MRREKWANHYCLGESGGRGVGYFDNDATGSAAQNGLILREILA
jgi:hypothetical protein